LALAGFASKAESESDQVGIGSQVKRRAVFLDRDGILNKAVVRNGKPYPPASVADVVIPFGVADGLTLLKSRGFLLIGVTNQPDVARGTTHRETVEAINGYLKSKLPLDEICVCFHDDADGCSCRKPNPGLILDTAERHEVNLAASYVVGDRWKDIEAGRKAGCSTVWVDYAYTEEFKTELPDFICKSPVEAFKWIFQRDKQ
jgi:D-glycero-D-manno-heptose 1,7-bisphosphate phosphatase